MEFNYTPIAGARRNTERENVDSYEAGARTLACGATFLWLVLGIFHVKHREKYIALLFVATAFALSYLSMKMREIEAAWDSLNLLSRSSSAAHPSEAQSNEHRIDTVPADGPASVALSSGISRANDLSWVSLPTLVWAMFSIISFTSMVSFVALIAFVIGNPVLGAMNITLAVSGVVVGYAPVRAISSMGPLSISRIEGTEISIQV
jgi:hypothetical protein